MIHAFTQTSDPAAFAQAMAVRQAVFVQEQQVPADLEWDEYDATALHFLVVDDTTAEPVAAGRMRPQDAALGTTGPAKIERMAVHKKCRGQGVGRLLLETMLTVAKEQGYGEAILAAQCHAQGFYESLGFVAEGDVFLDAGMDHVWMRKRLTCLLSS